MVRPPLWNIRYSSLLDDPFQECAFAVTQKESSAATVFPQRSYATCCLTINLAQLSLNDDKPQSNGSSVSSGSSATSEMESTRDSKSASPNGVVEAEEASENGFEVSGDSKENLTSVQETRALDEKSSEGPSPKRRRNQTNAD